MSLQHFANKLHLFQAVNEAALAPHLVCGHRVLKMWTTRACPPADKFQHEAQSR